MKIMAVDFGDARTGLACCDKTEFLASPIGVIHDRNFESVLQKVAVASVEYDVKEIVVGHPINMNGTIGDRAKLCEEFAQRLEKMVEVPVRLWDERGTTVSAIGFLNETDTRGKKRKETVDQLAAAIILESYLNYRRNHPEE
ncbi:Holliday junction resolvase RuvX [Youxingia wuxianensis]|uniref:Putative pre-16S rRNA nuclease n=1 Tax=Youxingia wuxianensis TaxID=2763678 RepID=A0A926EPZ6_9FIRM|nr:Holliday junction resolvase RuvX [Youxingia wuxianensis]MBC8586013.1 Holliday junction resolvase RuvX [Youxingia wuxianensis]